MENKEQEATPSRAKASKTTSYTTFVRWTPSKTTSFFVFFFFFLRVVWGKNDRFGSELWIKVAPRQVTIVRHGVATRLKRRFHHPSAQLFVLWTRAHPRQFYFSRSVQSQIKNKEETWTRNLTMKKKKKEDLPGTNQPSWRRDGAQCRRTPCRGDNRDAPQGSCSRSPWGY